MTQYRFLATVVVLLLAPHSFSQTIAEPPAITAQYTAISPTIDGDLTDEAWNEATPVTVFTQRELQEGAPATERTEVRILYDSHALYIGLWCYDRSPDEIIANEVKRDFPYRAEDDFELILDTYRDRRTGFLFIVNPNGARYDALVTDEGEDINVDWNGLWEARAKITSEGWFAEIAIPFSTLRFPDDDTTRWGINFARHIRR
ncbi:MAG TPA: carbohydrate binding family 9 domain-containing protein, partial [Bacteroidota bacterium]